MILQPTYSGAPKHLTGGGGADLLAVRFKDLLEDETEDVELPINLCGCRDKVAKPDVRRVLHVIHLLLCHRTRGWQFVTARAVGEEDSCAHMTGLLLLTPNVAA